MTRFNNYQSLPVYFRDSLHKGTKERYIIEIIKDRRPLDINDNNVFYNFKLDLVKPIDYRKNENTNENEYSFEVINYDLALGRENGAIVIEVDTSLDDFEEGKTYRLVLHDDKRLFAEIVLKILPKSFLM